MKDYLDLINDIAEKWIIEADDYAKRHFIQTKAGICLVLSCCILMGVIIYPFLSKEPNISPTSNSLYPVNEQAELQKISFLEVSPGGSGAQTGGGYTLYFEDLADFSTGNPSANQDIEYLPVFKSPNNQDDHYVISEEKLKEVARQYANLYGVENGVENYDYYGLEVITPDNYLSGNATYTIENDNMKVSVDNNYRVIITDKTKTNEYEDKEYTSLKEAKKDAKKILKEYYQSIHYDALQSLIEGGNLSSNNKKYYTIKAYQKGKDLRDNILNFYFTECYSNHNTYVFNHGTTGENIGEYPIISRQEIINQFITQYNDPYDIADQLTEDNIIQTEIIYIYNGLYTVPYYNLYVLHNYSNQEGKISVGQYQMPALSKDYFEIIKTTKQQQ